MRTFGLIGYPLGHSFSVAYFTRKFREEGIGAIYRNFPLEDISEFEQLIRGAPELAGLNVTVPYKEKVVPYLDALGVTARSIRAVNTICICRREERMALIGHNTDIAGFRQSLEEHLGPQHDAALVLGTGGSSRAVRYVLNELGIPFKPVSRSRGEGVLGYDELDGHTVLNHRLIINTTPLGMHPHVDSLPGIPYDAVTPGHLLFDLVYNPEKTRFLAMGEKQGAAIVNGYDMLVYQAEASWKIWNRQEAYNGQ